MIQSAVYGVQPSSDCACTELTPDHTSDLNFAELKKKRRRPKKIHTPDYTSDLNFAELKNTAIGLKRSIP